jgi:hypothetical protein
MASRMGLSKSRWLGLLLITGASVLPVACSTRSSSEDTPGSGDARWGRQSIVRTQSELAQLDEAVKVFCTAWNVDYLPSSITLNDGNPMSPSSRYLACVFGARVDISRRYKWNGQDTNQVTLSGHECLVFFLGGIPKGNGPYECQGFSNDPTDPTNFSNPAIRIQAPHFEFRTERLKQSPKTKFVYYTDISGKTPYAYFCSRGPSSQTYNLADCSGIDALGLSCGVPQPYYRMPAPNSFEPSSRVLTGVSWLGVCVPRGVWAPWVR